MTPIPDDLKFKAELVKNAKGQRAMNLYIENATCFEDVATACAMLIATVVLEYRMNSCDGVLDPETERDLIETMVTTAVRVSNQAGEFHITNVEV